MLLSPEKILNRPSLITKGRYLDLPDSRQSIIKQIRSVLLSHSEALRNKLIWTAVLDGEGNNVFLLNEIKSKYESSGDTILLEILTLEEATSWSEVEGYSARYRWKNFAVRPLRSEIFNQLLTIQINEEMKKHA